MKTHASHPALALALSLILAVAAQARTVTGVVIADGKPLAGAKVHALYLQDTSGLFNTRSADATTGADGAFSVVLPDMPAERAIFGDVLNMHVVVADAPGRSPALAVVRPDKADGYRLALPASRGIQVEVVDINGFLVEGADVALVPVRPNNGSWVSPPPDRLRMQQVEQAILGTCYRARTNARGQAAFSDVPTAPLELYVCHPTRGATHKALDARGGKVWAALEYAVYRIRGRLDPKPKGAPVQGVVQVESRGPRSTLIWPVDSFLMTRKDGTFELYASNSRKQKKPWSAHLRAYPLDPKRGFAAARKAVGVSEKPDGIVKVTLHAGRRVSGRVVGKTGTGIPAVVSAADGPFPKVWAHIAQRTDADGTFEFILKEDKAALEAAPLRADLAATELHKPHPLELPHDAPVVLTMETEPLVSHAVMPVDAQGKPAAGARVVVLQEGVAQPTGGTTDATGTLTVRDLRPTRPARVYVETGNRGHAGYVQDVRFDNLGDAPLKVPMKDTAKVSVLVVDPAGKLRRGSASVGLRNDHGVEVFKLSSGSAWRGHVTLIGLLPDVTHTVHVSANGAADQRIQWAFKQNDPTPTLKVTFPDLAPEVDQQAKQQEDQFERDKLALAGAKQRETDTVEKHLTWVIERSGPVVIDEKAKRVRRFGALFGLPDLKVSAIAFGPDRVWLGTDHGLMAWVRTTQAWSRFAVGGKFVAAPVTALTLKDNVLTVEIAPPNAGKQTHRFDLKMKTWR